MKPRPLPPNSSSRLRRRGTKAVSMTKLYGLIFLLFGTLVLWFTPPNDRGRGSVSVGSGSRSGSRSRSNDADITKHNDRPSPAVVIVECQVSTPHSRRQQTDAVPEAAIDAAAGASPVAHGAFRVAIFQRDANRRGSSAEAFLKLVRSGFYDETYTFRVVPGFVVQWGVRSGDGMDVPSTPAKERIPGSDAATTRTATTSTTTKTTNALLDDEIEDTTTTTTTNNASVNQMRLNLLGRKENRRGTITMIAGGSAQVFVNLGDNRRLDKEGTIPLGVILEDEEEEAKSVDGNNNNNNNNQQSGMRLVDSIYQGYKGGQGQIPAIKRREIAEKFPEMGRIDRCYLLE
uniref:PPIase cyclophilin-type domain-containing protein n=1 Tax=Pseudo-nitzschia australis TaxID=44445 RepID=A0A6U9XA65_9STRA